mmetsp:Transcript_40417/g.88373  ORF Transcript_40417/g.88373 Transcript_40417/m.88373 type:complete len:216 (+) Transcript_40417:115-762(+)
MGQLPADEERPGKDSLVCNTEFSHDSALSLRNGGHDSPPHVASRHCEIQRACHGRGGSRGIWLEARAWRRLQNTRVLCYPCGLRGLGYAASLYVYPDLDLCSARLAVTGTERWAAADNDASLHAHGCLCWLRSGPDDQTLRWRCESVEIDLLADSIPLPWPLLFSVLSPEPLHLGREVLRGGALHHHVCTPRSLVRRLRASRPAGLTCRLPQGAY